MYCTLNINNQFMLGEYTRTGLVSIHMKFIGSTDDEIMLNTEIFRLVQTYFGRRAYLPAKQPVDFR